MTGVLSIFCQPVTNPFEIEGRLKVTSVIETTKPIPQEAEQKISVTTSRVQTENKMDSLSFDKNPFEVSHVPIRKISASKPLVSKKVESGNDKEEVSKAGKSTTFLFLLMLFTWVLLALVLTNKRDLLPNLTKSLTNENMLKLMKREEKSGLTFHHVLLYLIYFINFSIFIYLIISNLVHFKISNGQLFLLCLCAPFLVYGIRHLGLYMIGNVFQLEKYTALFSYTILIYNIIIGIVLIPTNLIMSIAPISFFKPTMHLTLATIAILLVIRYFRGLFISSKFLTGNLFLFFLYLCSVEIAPILIGWRLISNL